MAIEGPLRELGIHDVFQLLDLSRKTGRLRVTSALRDNEGTVYFDAGRVVSATIRSNPHPLGEVLMKSGKVNEADLARARAMQAERGSKLRLGQILLEFGAITARELERQVRQQIEAVVFELMSWQEGFFSFEERDVSDAPSDAVASIATESLLMEGARRIDEWARIAHRIPHLGLVPVLASISDEYQTQLDLLPHEWETLGRIDGTTDLRGIATALGRSEFDVARIAYGLLSTGVIDLSAPDRRGPDMALGGDDPTPHLVRARAALEAGRADDALVAASSAVTAAPGRADARWEMARAFTRLGRHADALEELRRAAELDARDSTVQLALGLALARNVPLTEAIGAWQRYLAESPNGDGAPCVHELVECATRLQGLLEAHANG